MTPGAPRGQRLKAGCSRTDHCRDLVFRAKVAEFQCRPTEKSCGHTAPGKAARSQGAGSTQSWNFPFAGRALCCLLVPPHPALSCRRLSVTVLVCSAHRDTDNCCTKDCFVLAALQPLGIFVRSSFVPSTQFFCLWKEQAGKGGRSPLGAQVKISLATQARACI